MQGVWLLRTKLCYCIVSAATDYSPDGSVGLTGTVPESLANLTNLRVLELGPNTLSGSIPQGLCHSNIRMLSLSGNRLTADLTFMLACTGAARIDLGYNEIAGTLPNVRWGLYQLAGLLLNNNQINGTIPWELYQVPSLAIINLSKNRYNWRHHGHGSPMEHIRRSLCVQPAIGINLSCAVVSSHVWKQPCETPCTAFVSRGNMRSSC